ncbi:adenosylcobinamide-GDP ribazoletransferase [Alcaligenaceae bacterium]|nr:adenosylcobinamide-GDP ribazoletransferase [Alcaligenaceae bacterium]
MASESPSAWQGAALHQLRLFFTALQFFTRVPIPRWVGFAPEWLNHCTRYYPLVGLLVGAVAALAYAAAAQWWPVPVAVLLSTVATVYLTGAFHEDGFADVCDGVGGGLTRERAFEIMKDSRIGAYGTLGILLLLAVKCAALAGLPGTLAVAGALVAGHPVSRLYSAALIWRLEYAKEEGKAKPLGHRMSHGEFAVAAATGGLVLLLTGASGWLSWRALLGGVLLGAVATLWLARLFRRRLGGYTGDCLGAVQQLSETCFYLGVLAFAAGGQA